MRVRRWSIARGSRVGLLALALLALPAGAGDADPPRPRGRALLVGCTEYPMIRDLVGDDTYEREVRLQGPENDVRLLAEQLERSLGFDPHDIEVLAGWPDAAEQRPTLRNILVELERLSKTAAPNDLVVIQLAGHGVQVPDLDGDETDGLDEVFLPADVRKFEANVRGLPGSLSDDDLGRWVGAIRDRGARVWVILDSCHSGTMVRGGAVGARYRFLDSRILGIPRTTDPRRRREREGHSELDDLDGVVAFYAAQSQHKAPEIPLPQGDAGARVHGLLSYFVAQELERGASSFEELYARVVAGYQSLPYEGTLPLAEGRLDLPLQGSSQRGVPAILLRQEGDGLVANRGTLAGLRPGTRLAVFPPGLTLGETAGTVEVVEADVVSARCRVVQGEVLESLLAAGNRIFPARVLLRAVPELCLYVSAIDSAGRPLPFRALPPAARAFLEQESTLFPWIEDPLGASWLLVVEESRLLLRPTVEASGASLFEVTDDTLGRELQKIYRSRNLRSLATSGLLPRLPQGLEVEVRRTPPGGTTRPLRQGESLRPGDTGTIVLANHTGRTQDVTVLYLDAHHGITVLHPNRGKTPRLTPGDTREITLAEFKVNDRPTGSEHVLVMSLPRDEASDVTDLSWLGQRSLARTRGAPSPHRQGSLGLVLEAAAFGASHRGLTLETESEDEATAGLFSWETAWASPRLPSVWPEGTLSLEPGPARADGPFPALTSGNRRGILIRTSATGAPDLLLLGDEAPTRALLDIDGDTGTIAATAEIVDRFDAEMALDFLADRTIARYDTDGSGDFDLALVDLDGDALAEMAYSRTGEGAWTEIEVAEMSWFTTEHLRFLEPRDVVAAVAKLRSLAPED